MKSVFSPRWSLRGSKTQGGFTIIELLIVVTILSMLAGVLVPILEEGAASAREARRSADLKTVQSALEAFKRTTGAYPDTSDAWQGDPTAFGGLGYDAAGYIPGLVPNYMQSLPKDPDPAYPANARGYVYRSNGSDYKFVVFRTSESYPNGNPFFDPARPAQSWMVCSPGGYNW